MAPIRPANISRGVTTLISIIPLPMVVATAVPKIRKATKLKKAAQITAKRGDNTRVETTVAIELAASCRPLVKSKVKAIKIIKITKIKLSILKLS